MTGEKKKVGEFEKRIKKKMFDMSKLRFKDLPMTLTRKKIAEDVNQEYKEILEIIDEVRRSFLEWWNREPLLVSGMWYDMVGENKEDSDRYYVYPDKHHDAKIHWLEEGKQLFVKWFG